MKPVILFIFLTFLTLEFCFATHNLSGKIKYSHVSGYKYGIEIVTFTDDSPNIADRPKIEVHFGDGSSDSIARTTRTVISNGHRSYVENKYTTEHTYAGPGSFTISFTDNSRAGGIINIPNSLEQQFHIESELNIFSSHSNNSVEVSGDLVLSTISNTNNQISFACLDPDGDQLHFAFDSIYGVSSFTFPAGATIDSENGEISWNPTTSGSYIFSILVQECRENKITGTSHFDLIVDVLPGFNTSRSFSKLVNWQKNTSNNYIAQGKPGQPISLNLGYNDLSADSVTLEAMGHAFQSVNPATFTTTNLSATSIEKKFDWTPHSSDHACSESILLFRGISYESGNPYPFDLALLLDIRNPNLSCTSCNLVLGTESKSVEVDKVLVHPNPMINECRIEVISQQEISSLKVILFDQNGRTLDVVNNHRQNSILLSKGNLPTGMIFYRLSVNDTYHSSGRLMVGSK